MARPPKTSGISDGKTLREMLDSQETAVELGLYGAFEAMLTCPLSNGKRHVVIVPAAMANIDLDARPRYSRLVWCDWVGEKTAKALRPDLDEWRTGWTQGVTTDEEF